MDEKLGAIDGSVIDNVTKTQNDLSEPSDEVHDTANIQQMKSIEGIEGVEVLSFSVQVLCCHVDAVSAVYASIRS